MIKKVLALLLAMVVLFSLAGCKEEATTDKNENTTKPTEATKDNHKEEIITVYICTKTQQYRNDQETYRHEYEYDSNGNLIWEISYYYDYDPILTNSFEYKYDRKGKLIRKSTFVNDEEATREEYEYDDGQHATMVCYTNNEFHCQWEYEYDSNGNQVLAVQTRNGKEAERYEYEYDDVGNLITEVRYYGGIEKEREEYTYDNSGNCTLWVNYTNDRKLYHTEYEYDRNSNLVLKIDYVNDQENSRHEWEYDSRGNTIQAKYCYGDQTDICRYVYTYSDDGCVVESTSDTKGIFTYQKVSISRAQAEKLIEENGDLTVLLG